MTDIPKKRLREVHPNIPVEIKNNMLKRGFPIPFKNWNELNCIMEDAHRMFFNRKEFASEKPYSGINRYQWAVYQAELFLEKINW
jgi:hypothetical protein